MNIEKAAEAYMSAFNSAQENLLQSVIAGLRAAAPLLQAQDIVERQESYDQICQRNHDLGLENVTVKAERDEWRRKYREIEHAHSRAVDRICKLVRKIQERERDLAERGSQKSAFEQECISLRRQLQAQPEPVDGDEAQEIVTHMLNAYFAAAHEPYCYPPNKVDGMAAALRVAADRLLAEPNSDEKRQMISDFSAVAERENTSGWDNFYHALGIMFANRRASLTAKKTPEEEVEAILAKYGLLSSGQRPIAAAEIIAKLRESEGVK